MTWKIPKQWSAQERPSDIPYFLDAKSTTERAFMVDPEGFEIDVQNAGLQTVMPDECLSLGIAPGSYHFVREVELRLLSTPVMFARLVVPYFALETVFRQIKQLGSQSLGRYLFKLSGIQREPFKINQLFSGEPLYECSMQSSSKKPAAIWARRSIFRYKKAPLLLTEVFLPEYSSILNLATCK